MAMEEENNNNKKLVETNSKPKDSESKRASENKCVHNLSIPLRCGFSLGAASRTMHTRTEEKEVTEKKDKTENKTPTTHSRGDAVQTTEYISSAHWPCLCCFSFNSLYFPFYYRNNFMLLLLLFSYLFRYCGLWSHFNILKISNRDHLKIYSMVAHMATADS